MNKNLTINDLKKILDNYSDEAIVKITDEMQDVEITGGIDNYPFSSSLDAQNVALLSQTATAPLTVREFKKLLALFPDDATLMVVSEYLDQKAFEVCLYPFEYENSSNVVLLTQDTERAYPFEDI